MFWFILLLAVMLPVSSLAQLGTTAWPKYLGNPLNTSQGLGSGTTSTAAWTYTAQAPIYTSPAIGADGTIYFGSDDSNVYAVNGKTGALKWSFATLSYVESSPAIGTDGTIYVGGDDANVYALNGSTGALKWSYTTGSFIDSSPAIGPDGTVYVGSTDGNVYALNGATGAVIWTFATQGSVESSPAVGSDGTVYIGSDDGNLYAIAGATGVQSWSYNIGLAVYNPPSIGPDGTVFVGEDQVYAFNPTSGNLLWSAALTDDITGPISISANETLYVATADGIIHAINGTNQVATWIYQGPSGLYEAAPVIGADGTVYVASDGGVITALNGATGNVYWTTSENSDSFGATPAIGSDGTLYIGALSGTLSAFGPLALTGVTVSPTTIAPGDVSTGTVTFNLPVPGTSVNVALTSDSPYVSVPASISVAQLASSGTFQISASSVPTTTVAHITAKYLGASFTVPITVNPTALVGVSFTPNAVAGGTVATGTVTLNGPAPSGGIQVTLTGSSASYAKVPAWAIVPEGNTTGTFLVPTVSVTTGHAVTVTAKFGGVTETTTLGIDPALLAKITANPPNFAGGTTSTGTVSITGPAPSSGIQVKLTSSNTKAATVPASVTIPSKKTSATFVIHSYAVSSTESVAITGAIGTSTLSVTVTVMPPSLSTVTVAPRSLVGGAGATGTVTLTGPAGPGGATVALASSVSSATVPTSVVVASGHTSVTFPIKTVPVGANVSATIKGTFAAVTSSGTLTINAPTLTSLSLSPSSVGSGKSSVGTVHISSPAPAGGLVVTLSSGSTNATVPASVTILAGKTSGTFAITTATVKSKTTVTLSSALNGTTKTAVLTIL